MVQDLLGWSVVGSGWPLICCHSPGLHRAAQGVSQMQLVAVLILGSLIGVTRISGRCSFWTLLYIMTYVTAVMASRLFFRRYYCICTRNAFCNALSNSLGHCIISGEVMCTTFQHLLYGIVLHLSYSWQACIRVSFLPLGSLSVFSEHL